MIVDWRDVAEWAMVDAYARERERWIADLGWDTGDGWEHVEGARRSWGLPGLAQVDDRGHVLAFTFFYDDGERVEFGGLFGDLGAAGRALLDSALEVCRGSGARTITGLQYASETGVHEFLLEAGCAIERVDYLSCVLDVGGTGVEMPISDTVAMRAWSDDDLKGVADLLHAAYAPSAAARFVRQHTPEGWQSYLSRLLAFASCGRLLPAQSVVAVEGNQIVGVALATALGPGTAHLPQVGVHPRHGGRGLGRRLVSEAVRGLQRAEGYRCVTLLVDESNTVAQSVYRHGGFRPRAEFYAVAAMTRGDAGCPGGDVWVESSQSGRR